MRASEDRLAKKDPGSATRGIQKDIVKDLDKLIEENQRQQQQQQQQGGGGSATQRRLQEEQQKNGGAQANKGGQKQKSSGREGKKDGQKKESAGKNPKDKEGKGKEGKIGSKEGNGGSGKDRDSSKIADLYKDIWGHLPETMRQEMDAYSREQFMEKYKGLLKQYYSSLSEKGRGKNE
jgi:hypothetical protein